MSAAWAALHGLHAPNGPLSAFQPVLGTPERQPLARWWRRARDAQVRWIKLLAEEHPPADAAIAKGWGLKVILRMPGEGTVHYEALTDAIARYGGAVDVIELGNEPPTTGLPAWQHCYYLEACAEHCADAAAAAGIALCTPGWQAALDPPNPDGDDLQRRQLAVYTLFPWVGYHDYDANSLTTAAHTARLAAWARAFSRQALLVTEYGIADRVLPGTVDEGASDLVKVDRYMAYLTALQRVPAVQGACAFIAGGTATWAAFNDAAGGYTPLGRNRYWLSDAAWQYWGRIATGPGSGR